VGPGSNDDTQVPPPFGALIRQLIDDFAAYFDAERQIYSVQARLTRRAIGWAAVYAFAAIVLAQGAMIAFVVGVLLILGPIVGRGWAMGIIVLICTFSAALFFWLIRQKLRMIKIAWRRRNDG
jgi:Putative Actinobacterial Holin-X, holin superfamily III